jgi:hypothetical protein
MCREHYLFLQKNLPLGLNAFSDHLNVGEVRTFYDPQSSVGQNSYQYLVLSHAECGVWRAQLGLLSSSY